MTNQEIAEEYCKIANRRIQGALSQSNIGDFS